MMDLAVVCWLIAPRPRTRVEFCVQAQALVEVCPAFKPPGVDGAVKRVHQGGVANLGKLVSEKL